MFLLTNHKTDLSRNLKLTLTSRVHTDFFIFKFDTLVNE